MFIFRIDRETIPRRSSINVNHYDNDIYANNEMARERWSGYDDMIYK